MDSVYDLEYHKSGLDYALWDLLNTPDVYKRGWEYKTEVRDLVLSYHYLLARIFDWGSEHPYSPVLRDPRYQELVRQFWQDSLSLIEDYEYHNGGDTSLRRELIGHLYNNLANDRLAEEPFYRDLVRDIGWEMEAPAAPYDRGW